MEGFKDDQNKSNQQTSIAKKVTGKVKHYLQVLQQMGLQVRHIWWSYYKYIEYNHEENFRKFFN